MDSLILKSVIEITRQREMDSLELSLVTTLSEIVPLHAIALYKSHMENRTVTMEQIIRLSPPTAGETDYSWDTEKKTITMDDHLRSCIQSASVISHRTGHGLVRLLYPIFLEHKPAGVLALESHEDLLSWQAPIEALIRIYSNYLTVLNESERDKLTGLLNRRTFDYKLDKLLQQQRNRQATSQYRSTGSEQRQPLPGCCAWLAMVDIDHFKRINDRFGHLFGDEVILTLSQKMRQFFRTTDLLFRVGGEEFVVILEPIPAEMARQTFNRFSRTIATCDFPQAGKTTISIGYTGIRDGDYPHTILDQADKALYYAKENGRNCVFNYHDLLEAGRLSGQQPGTSAVFFDED